MSEPGDLVEVLGDKHPKTLQSIGKMAPRSAMSDFCLHSW